MAVFRSCNLIAHKCREVISLSTPSFFDVVNLWENRDICFYGPVVFIYDVAVLELFENIYVSKSNPMYWNSGNIHENSFSSIEELNSCLQPMHGFFPIDNHIILHNQSKLDFRYLKKVVMYCPEDDLFKIDNNDYLMQLNNPDEACNDLQSECLKCKIEFYKKILNEDRWNQLLEKPSQIGRFYGFRGKVPQ